MSIFTGGWSFHNPVRIHAGVGALSLLPDLLHGDGELLVMASPGFRRRHGVERLESLVAGRRLRWIEDIAPNPELSYVEEQLHHFATADIAEVVAIGGGSVIDTAKILVAGLGGAFRTLRGHLLEGEPLGPRKGLRLICIPTTAGTGSEVTPFATVWDQAGKRKLSVAGEAMFPEIALLDPELTLTLPEDVALSTGLDALTQAFEATWSRRANPVTTAFATGAIRRALRALPALQTAPADLALRSAMLEASVLAGLAISHSRTALCHSISYPITAHTGLPHGYACAFTLPEVFAFNRTADAARFEQLAREVGFHSAEGLHRHLLLLLESLDLRARLLPFLGDGSGLAALAGEMLTPGRAGNNLREATVKDAAAIVVAACRGRGLTVL